MRIAILLLCAASLAAQESFPAGPALDSQIEQAIHDGLIPGAVLLIGHDGKTLYRKAYGSRALIPKREAMTVDTIFDAASLTKVIATTSCLMKLFEEGKIRLNDPVTKYLPEFQGGKSDITVRNLMTHFSGLRPDLDLKPAWSGYETGIHRALIDPPAGPPGARFVYSDINFILLGEIVHRLSGRMLNIFAQDEVFTPLGMKDTRFLPAANEISRIAPTEIDPATGQVLRGVVHDDTSRYMGGVAGHAGLFTTADDLAKFAQMMLDLGEADGKRLFSPLTIREFTSPQSPADQPILRGLGWDIDSPFSSNRGELFPIGSFGHTGFTGTSVWIDPLTKSYVILLTNVVHPHRGKSLTSFRNRVATTTAAALGIDVPGVLLTGYNDTITGAGIHRVVARNAHTLTGLDVLVQEHFAPLRGKRIGLITNHTGLSRDGKRNIDLMVAGGVPIKSLFSPEHGIGGAEDQENVGNSTDAATGLPVISLYEGPRRRITPEMLTGLDALVFDIQDVGARFYTYSCALLYSMEEAGKKHVPFYVLDRPNPITGVHVEGPVLDKDLESYVGCYEMPLRHGLTFGELAAMVNGEEKLGADLHVIEMKDWQRGDWFDTTDLEWVDPSPNMRSLNAALLYPGVAMLEALKNYSVGRGTDSPFEQIGADWIDGEQLAAFLNGRYIPGVRAYATRFRPTASNFKGQMIPGVRFVITDRNALDSTRLGVELGYALEKLYPRKINWDTVRFLIGNHAVVEAGKQATDARTVVQSMEDSVRDFTERREKYLLYK
ncbi:MAG TPA: exo-beta-N-acetylmuramidase NamZ domain-containing protein [Bryobacteraceae bacterium]|nr:exo-beta-N-acetylmuramidase NamZ domain-containing protein [Bryobacteraceae bacterium]